ncbi:S1 RNA-binding domain-containing protein [Gemmiger sp.]|uniref:S1 RNA-binding domain-containing protein n=1 Tax=Gemmiger sp. TaxID=2049027 RepID=UPI002A9121F0|nr:S1 RNA-binding domain-containing protein [Gemmiger sp.]MDY5605342.1 S1 RNA-binding domain-containing protein [Gemmiger sp.]
MALQVGDIVEGKVTGIKPFGAFVSLPEGKTGLVHISEVSYEFVQDLSAVLSDGQTVQVKVLSIAPDGKIALSIKRLLPPPPRQPREGRGPAGGARPGAPRPGGPREGGHFGAGRGGNGRPSREGGRGPARDSAPRVWQPKAPVHSDNMSFEDMMSRFKSQSEEKMADLDHETNNRRGGGYAPRGRGGRR